MKPNIECPHCGGVAVFNSAINAYLCSDGCPWVIRVFKNQLSLESEEDVKDELSKSETITYLVIAMT